MKTKTYEPTRIPSKVYDHGKRSKDYDLRIGTLNLRTLHKVDASAQLADALIKCRTDITAIQEMRWKGQGCKRIASCGFVVNKRLRHLVSVFCPTEEKDDGVKDAFYVKLEDVCDKCPAHNAKIVIGDFNAKVGREGIFGPTVGQFSFHANTICNGMRLIDFAAARNMVVCSTRFQYLDIHKATWMSPDRSTLNQIDHIVIDGKHVSSVLDVRTFRGPNMDSDHYLVAVKFRLRISASRTASSSKLRKLDVRKLRSQRTAEALSAPLSDKLRRFPSNLSDISGQWANISHSLRTTAETVLSFER